MNNEKKVVYKVICPFDKRHIFPIVSEVIEQNEEDTENATLDAHCPFCGKYVRVTVKEKLVQDIETLRQAGFEFS